MEQLLEFFKTLKKSFPDDASTTKIIDEQIKHTNEWIGEHTAKEPERSPRNLGKVEASDNPDSARSLFDDIDADEDSESA